MVGGSVVKTLPTNAGDAGDPGSISGLRSNPGGGNGNPLQYILFSVSNMPVSKARYSP